MSAFDAAFALAAAIAIIFGYQTGLLRSVATIVGYLCAAPIAVKLTSLAYSSAAVWSSLQTALMFCVAFIGIGVAMAGAFRTAISDMVGDEVGLADRVAGSALGGFRIVLVALTLVLVFDRIIPAGREPAFLAGSALRPLLSIAGQAGLRSLPPETAAFIDQIRNRPVTPQS